MLAAAFTEASVSHFVSHAFDNMSFIIRGICEGESDDGLENILISRLSTELFAKISKICSELTLLRARVDAAFSLARRSHEPGESHSESNPRKHSSTTRRYSRRYILQSSAMDKVTCSCLNH
jgi:hypothetical protein